MSDKQDAQRPFYLREDSSDESSGGHSEGEGGGEGGGGVGGGESGKGGPEKKPNWPWKRKGNDKGKGKEGNEGDGDDEREGRKSSDAERERERQARVGRVEVDPAINYADWTKTGPGLDSKASMDEEGMINIWVDMKKVMPDLPKDYARPVKEWGTDPATSEDCPPLNIVIFIVGSRGDVQPFLSLALRLVQSHAHRVRIATHPDFKDFVLSANKRLQGKTCRGVDLEGRIEFFDVGGDPKELMAYMVKNPGLLPGWEALKNGDIASKRRMTSTMLHGFYRSTFEPNNTTRQPFAADAIISNPPAFAHVHIAEALGLPLLMSFTMPWSPTMYFKHPLVNIKNSNAEKGLTNYLTFALADMLTWQGLGDVINLFRTGTLGLEPLTARSGASTVERLRVPWTYCWSEGLIEKPDDWKEHIDISGFYFMEGDSDYEPDSALVEFLKAGKPPIYIGFGSVVVEDPAAMTATIFEAVQKAGVRALVSAGWGGLGEAAVPNDVFILKGNIPHDWLFAEGRVAAVCHHGGAGTTAIGLRNGLPTIVVPFFGDQAFWGDMIHRAGAGPEPIPHKLLTVENLASAIEFAVSDEAKAAAGVMGEQIRSEKGEEKGVASFHKHLPLKNMRCDVDPDRVAHWWSNDLCLRLSGAVAGLLAEQKRLDLTKLQPLRAREYQSRWRTTDPITGGSTAVLHMVSNHYGGVAQIFYNPPKGILNTMTAVPQGMLDLIVALHEGFDALPKRMGSRVRQRGEVKDFGTGVIEGGKGLWWGWWDGITGLVTEPVEGGMKEGVLGAIKGAGRSYVNVTARPAAGILGVMALPIHGAWRSLRRQVAGQPQKSIRKPREALSMDAAKRLTPEEKERLLKAFEEKEKGTAQRKKRLRKRAKLLLKGDERGFEDDPSAAGDGDAEVEGEGGKGVQSGGETSEGEDEELWAKVAQVGEEQLESKVNEAEVGKGSGSDVVAEGGGEGESPRAVKVKLAAGDEAQREKTVVEERGGEDAPSAADGKGDADVDAAEKRGYERAMREMKAAGV